MACESEYEENVDNLRKLFKANNIVSFNIQHIQCSAGSSSGDNYMSVVKRIQIRGHHNCDNYRGMTFDLPTAIHTWVLEKKAKIKTCSSLFLNCLCRVQSTCHVSHILIIYSSAPQNNIS